MKRAPSETVGATFFAPKPRPKWPRNMRPLSDGSGEIALSGARLHPLALHVQLERVHLPVEGRRRESQRVLMMELVGDAGKGRRKIARRRQLEVPASGRRGDFRQTLVRFVDDRP